MTELNIGKLEDIVANAAKDYENALVDLEHTANAAMDAQGSMSISNATVATTKIQITQSLMEMVTGIAKNATDHLKGLGRKITG